MKQFRRRMIGKGLAMALIISSLVNVQNISAAEKEVKFTDIKGHWAEGFITEFAQKGYVNGYEDNTFRPNNNITRAEFIKIINMTFGFTNTSTEDFEDVDSNDWFYKDVLKAVEAGYIDGYMENGVKIFKPNQQITREEACKIIAVVLKTEKAGRTSFNDDKEIADWSIKYVNGLVELGIIDGFAEDNTFRPQNQTTRAETVKTAYKAEKHKDEDEDGGGGITPPPPVVDKNIIIDGDSDFNKLDKNISYESITITNGVTGELNGITTDELSVQSGNITLKNCTIENLTTESATRNNDIVINVVGETTLQNIVLNVKTDITLQEGVEVENLVVEETAGNTKISGNATITNADIKASEVVVDKELEIENEVATIVNTSELKGNKIELLFNHNLSQNINNSEFKVTQGNKEVTIKDITVEGNKITINLDRAYGAGALGANIKVAYNGQSLLNGAGNKVSPFDKDAINVVSSLNIQGETTLEKGSKSLYKAIHNDLTQANNVEWFVEGSNEQNSTEGITINSQTGELTIHPESPVDSIEVVAIANENEKTYVAKQFVNLEEYITPFENIKTMKNSNMYVEFTLKKDINIARKSNGNVKFEYLDAQGNVIYSKDKVKFDGYLNDSKGNKYGQGLLGILSGYGVELQSNETYSTAVTQDSEAAQAARDNTVKVRLTVTDNYGNPITQTVEVN